MQCNCQTSRILTLREQEVGLRLFLDGVECHSNANPTIFPEPCAQTRPSRLRCAIPTQCQPPDTCHSGHPINTICSLTLASGGGGTGFFFGRDGRFCPRAKQTLLSPPHPTTPRDTPRVLPPR